MGHYSLGETEVTLTGKVVKQATCEKCGCVYRYVMVRKGVGSVRNSIFTFDEETRAQAKAEKSLQSQLRESVDPVPCPTCGHYQRSMVWEVKTTWLGRLVGGGLLLTFLCWLVPFLYVNAINETWKPGRQQLNAFWWPGLYIATAMAVAGLVVLVSYNPNRIPIRLFRRYTGQMIRPGHVGAPLPAVLPAPAAIGTAAPMARPMARRPMDTVTIECAKCGKEYPLKPEMLGKKVRCKACQTVFEAAEKEIDLSDLA